MTIIQKRIMLVTMTVLLAFLLAGCGGGSKSSPDQVTGIVTFSSSTIPVGTANSEDVFLIATASDFAITLPDGSTNKYNATFYGTHDVNDNPSMTSQVTIWEQGKTAYANIWFDGQGRPIATTADSNGGSIIFTWISDVEVRVHYIDSGGNALAASQLLRIDDSFVVNPLMPALAVTPKPMQTLSYLKRLSVHVIAKISDYILPQKAYALIGRRLQNWMTTGWTWLITGLSKRQADQAAALEPLLELGTGNVLVPGSVQVAFFNQISADIDELMGIQSGMNEADLAAADIPTASASRWSKIRDYFTSKTPDTGEEPEQITTYIDPPAQARTPPAAYTDPDPAPRYNFHITPGSTKIKKGGTVQLGAFIYGTNEDITNNVVWRVDTSVYKAGVAEVTAGGLVTAHSSGWANIIATDGAGNQATAVIVVLPNFNGIYTYSQVFPDGFTHTENDTVSGELASGTHTFVSVDGNGDPIGGSFTWQGEIWPSSADPTMGNITGTGMIYNCGSVLSFVMLNGTLRLNGDGSADLYWGGFDSGACGSTGNIGGQGHRP